MGMQKDREETSNKQHIFWREIGLSRESNLRMLEPIRLPWNVQVGHYIGSRREGCGRAGYSRGGWIGHRNQELFLHQKSFKGMFMPTDVHNGGDEIQGPS